MITRRRNRSVPSLNTTSTADISFMLLIFFLVTSSMNVDKGLARVLPPSDKQEQSVETLVERDQLLTITVTAYNRFLVNDQPAEQATLMKLILRCRMPSWRPIVTCVNEWQGRSTAAVTNF